MELIDKKSSWNGKAGRYEKEIKIPPMPKPKKKISWDSVILPQEIKEQIMATLSQTENRKTIFEDWGFEDVLEKGSGLTMLFDGPPGTGKTLAAEAIADQLGKTLFICNSGSILSMFAGEAEKKVTEAFKKAKEKDEVLLFDEAESLLHDRDRVTSWMRAFTNHLLTLLERHEGVVIFTTNRIQDLDRALERRVSLKLTFPFPDQTARALIWRRMIPAKCPLAEDVDLQQLAECEMAGGDIKNIVLNAVRTAVYQKSETVTLDHFFRAIETEERSKARFKKMRKERLDRLNAGQFGVFRGMEEMKADQASSATEAPAEEGGVIQKQRKKQEKVY